MPIYIKEIRGNLYYYEQYSVYQGSGLPPRTPTRYIGPVNPKRRKGRIAGFIEANFKHEPGEVAADKAMAEFPPPVITRQLRAQPTPIDKPAPTLSLKAPDALPAAEPKSSAGAEPDSSSPADARE